jgi:hypothetical protein
MLKTKFRTHTEPQAECRVAYSDRLDRSNYFNTSAALAYVECNTGASLHDPLSLIRPHAMNSRRCGDGHFSL